PCHDVVAAGGEDALHELAVADVHLAAVRLDVRFLSRINLRHGPGHFHGYRGRLSTRHGAAERWPRRTVVVYPRTGGGPQRAKIERENVKRHISSLTPSL